MDVASAVSSSKCKQVGSGKIVGGGKGDLGLLGEGDKRPSSVSSPPSPHPAWFTKIMDEPQNRGKLTPRCVQSPGRRLVDGRSPARRVGGGGAGDGDLEPAAGEWGHPPF